jgi:hypothetical protein
LAAAEETGWQANRLHGLLCELISRPCRPCISDPALTLARIGKRRRSQITAADIDNCSHRHLALSMDLMLQLFLCVAGKIGATE